HAGRQDEDRAGRRRAGGAARQETGRSRGCAEVVGSGSEGAIPPPSSPTVGVVANRSHPMTVRTTKKTVTFAKSPFEKGDSPGGRFVIHVWDVDTSDARPLGRDREEDQAVSDRSDRRRMGADCAAVAGAAEAGPQAQGGPARGAERDPLHDAHGGRL